MTRIAQKKLEQMGATVHGVLAKNEVGRWVAVSESGRVMWLDNFEGQASSAQGEPSSAGVVPEGFRDQLEQLVLNAYYSTDEEDKTVNADDLRTGIDQLMDLLTAAPTPEAVGCPVEPPCDCIHKEGDYWQQRCDCGNSGDLASAQSWCDRKNTLTPEAGQSGGVPEHDEYHQMAFEIGQPCENGEGYFFDCSELDEFVAALYAIHPHNGEQGGEWLPFETAPQDGTTVLLGWWETWPEKKWCQEVKPAGNLDTCRPGMCSSHGRATHWMPLPQPPKSKEDRGHE